MRCELVQPYLGALLDRELTGLLRWRVRRHVLQCPHCQAELRQLETLHGQLVRIAPFLPVPRTRPISRPIGMTLALLGGPAATALLLALWPRPALITETPVPTRPEVPAMRIAPNPPAAVQVPRPSAPPVRVAVSPRTARPKRRGGRRTSYRRPSSAPTRLPAALEPEVIVVQLPTAQPLTFVQESHDDEGGSIRIETTIPAPYVAAMQVALRSSGETNL